MDFCVDCNRKLRDLFCSTCKILYVIEVSQDMPCRNCSHSMIQRGSKYRYRCNYCLHRYFEYKNYSTEYEEAIEEYIGSLEKNCPECRNRMLINPGNQELVCRTCGLVYEDPIYTEI